MCPHFRKIIVFLAGWKMACAMEQAVSTLLMVWVSSGRRQSGIQPAGMIHVPAPIRRKVPPNAVLGRTATPGGELLAPQRDPDSYFWVVDHHT